MPSNQTTHGARPSARSRRARAGLLALTLATSSSACNSLLDVDNPGRVPVEALEDPALAPVLEAAALQQFQCAFAQYVATAGMLSGEYLSANAFVDNHIWEWRGVTEIKQNPGSCPGGRAVTSMGFYTPLQQARFQLEDLEKRMQETTDALVPTRPRILAETAAYGGYAYLLLGEGMCSMAVDNGPEMTRAQTLAIAETRFTTAIARATALNDASLRNMATVGRARTRLNLNNLPGAAADAALVPAGFVRNAEYSEVAVTRENRLFNLTIRNDYLSVGPDYRGLTVGTSTPDPRVRVTNVNRNGADNATPIWQQQKFIGTGAVSLPIASYAEAQLILAEATGGEAGLAAINRVRALTPGVPALTAVPADFTALVLEERRRQLFSEGHRYGDMLRKNLPFISTGANRKGQTYSNLTCVPLPDVETRNNPNLNGSA